MLGKFKGKYNKGIKSKELSNVIVSKNLTQWPVIRVHESSQHVGWGRGEGVEITFA